MTSDVVLTSALRSNLLSLQTTQRNIDATQLRLATGLKVNSALYNPQNFFAGQSLENRASDLTRLLDGIGQSISTIQAADEGIKALTTLVEQADSLATTALEATSSAAQSASVIGDVDVSEYEFTTAVAGTISFTFTDQAGETITLDASGGDVAVANGDSIDDFINSINAIRDENDDRVVSAALTDSGRLQISTVNGANARIEIDPTTTTLATSQTLAGQLGFSSFLSAEAGLGSSQSGSDEVAFNLETSSTMQSLA